MAQWFWRDDDDWKEYNKRTNGKLERSFSAGDDECSVDTQRYVDFKNMLQRRKDDHSKRRPVKREYDEPEFFEEETVLLVGAKKEKDKWRQDVDSAGGIVVSKMSKKVTFVIMSEETFAKPKTSKTIKDAASKGIPILSPKYIDECLEKEELVDNKKFVLVSRKRKATSDIAEEAPGVSGESTEGSEEATIISAGARELKEAAKKAADASPAFKEAAEPSARPAKKPKRTGKAEEEPPAPAPMPPREDPAPVAPTGGAAAIDQYLQKGSMFSGVCQQEGFSPYPFTFTIASRSAGDLTGTIAWMTLGPTITKCKGTVTSDGLVTVVEDEVVTGDEVDVPNTYKGRLDASGTYVGTFTDSVGETGTFSLTNTYFPPVPTDQLRPNSTWNGVALLPFSFELAVLTRDGDTFEGTATWPGMNNSQTKVRGVVRDGLLKFEEYEVIRGEDEVDIPNTFECALTDAAVHASGKFVGASVEGEGTFRMSLQQ